MLSVFDDDNAASVDWPSILSRITCPALLITDESAAELKDLVPHPEIVHVPEAGHDIRRDQFSLIMNVVEGFLARHQGQRMIVS